MAKDTQLSTLLLLAVLAVVIYCLTSSETFESVAAESETPMVHPNTVAAQTASAPAPVVAPQQAPQQAAKVAIAPEVLKQIVAETEKPTLKSKDDTEKVDSVFNFDANDNATADGADLSSAFSKPIPSQQSSDMVNMTKNNVKNYNAKDFLPKEVNDEWFDTDFSQAKYNINDDKLINTERYVIGVNTVGQSLKNASYDIRGTIPNPKFSVSPWNNSTYEPDFNLKPLC